MKQLSVQARAPKIDKEATISVNYAETVEEAVQMFGEEALLTNAFANWRVTLQAGIRSALASGLEQDAIQKKFADAKMGVAVTGAVDPQAAFIAKFKSAPPEEQAKMLALLKASAAGK